MKTWQQIAECVNDLEKQHIAWENDDAAPVVEYERRQVKVVTQAIDRRWNELLDEVNGQHETEKEAYELVMAIDDWEDEVNAFRDDPASNPGGTQCLWKAWQNVVAHSQKKPKPSLLESIAFLSTVQNVTPLQIAKIYEWKDEFGQWDQARALKAIETKDDTVHVSPHYQRYLNNVEERWEKRQSRKMQSRTVVEPPKSTDPVIAPESIKTLLEQNVTSKQIARMKNVDQQTVIDYARELKIPVDGNVPGPSLRAEQHLAAVREKESIELAGARQHLEEIDKPAKAPKLVTHSSLDNYREQVRQMALDGHEKAVIFESLKEQHPDKCKMSSVAQIVAAVEREEAALSE